MLSKGLIFPHFAEFQGHRQPDQISLARFKDLNDLFVALDLSLTHRYTHTPRTDGEAAICPKDPF